MKKNIVIFAVFCIVFAAFSLVNAQSELPAIDETEAAGLLGTWYAEQICFEDSCLNMADLGSVAYLEINADNTLVFHPDGVEPNSASWYMKDGEAYYISTNEDDSQTEYSLILNDDGTMTLLQVFGCLIYSREEPAVTGNVESAADVALADFIGEWHSKGFLMDDVLIPASFFGNDIVLNVSENAYTIDFGQGNVQEAEFTCTDGKLYAVVETTDDEGNSVKENVVIDYRSDGSLVVMYDPDTEDAAGFVFTREVNTHTMEDLLDSLSNTVSEEGGFSLSGLLENQYVSPIIEKLETQSGIDVNGIIEQVESEGSFDLSSLFSTLTSGEGTDEGEGGSFSLSGLLDLFGSGK